MKRIAKTAVALLLVLVFTSGVLPPFGTGLFVASAAEVASGCCGAEVNGVPGENVRWTLSEDGVLTVTGEGETQRYGLYDMSPPWSEYNGGDLPDVVRAEVGEGITVLGVGFFAECRALTEVSLPDSLERIGSYAFFNTPVAAPSAMIDGVAYVGRCAVAAGENPVLRDGTELLADGLFSQYGGEIRLPASVRYIGEAFGNGIDNGTSDPDPVSWVTVDPGNPYFASYDGLLYTRDLKTMLYCPGSRAGAVELPDGLEVCGNFRNRRQMTSLSFGAALREFSPSLLNGCEALTAVEVRGDNPCYYAEDGVLYSKDLSRMLCYPAGRVGPLHLFAATAVESTVFNDFLGQNVTEVIVEEGNPFFRSENGALFSAAGDTLYYCTRGYEGVFSVPEGVETIYHYAFSGCAGLTGLVLPDTLRYVEMYAFENCVSLTEVTLPDSVKRLELYAFRNCTSLQSADLGEGLEQMRSGVFSGCTALTSLTLPASLRLAEDVFAGMTSLEFPEIRSRELAFDYTGEVRLAEGTAFRENEANWQNDLLIVDGVLLEARNVSGAFTVPAGIHTIGPAAFARGCDLTELTVPEGVVCIANNAFHHNDRLAVVRLPSSLRRLEANVFTAPALREISLPDGMTFVNSLALEGSGFVGADAPNPDAWEDGLLYCGSVLLKADPSLSGTVTVRPGTTLIAAGAFQYAEGAESVILPEGLRYINEYAFPYLGAQSVRIPDSVVNFDRAFQMALFTEELILPESLEEIGSFSFAMSYKLKKPLRIPKNVKSIAEDAFIMLFSLEGFSVDPENPYYASEDGVLYNKDKTRLIAYPGGRRDASFFVPNGVREISPYAFMSASLLRRLELPDSIESLDLRFEPSLYDAETRLELREMLGVETGEGISSVVYHGTPEEWSGVRIRYDGYNVDNDLIYWADKQCGHTFGAWYTVTPADYEREGLERRDCVCGLTETREIPKTEPVTYTATFIADGKTVGKVEFPAGASSLTEPPVPEKERFLAAWEPYTLADADLTVRAVYTPLKEKDLGDAAADATAEVNEPRGLVRFTLSASADAKSVRVRTRERVPLDVVLVMDQSGSMADRLGDGTKLEAARQAAADFIDLVAADARSNGLEHRIGIVGFGMGSGMGYSSYYNTELLTGRSGAVPLSRLRNADYANALVPVLKDGSVNAVLTRAVAELDASGATAADLGLGMAKDIFAADPAGGRQRLVVFMTDGSPTYGNTFDPKVANAAIYNAKTLKTLYNADVYAVGVMTAAEATDPDIAAFLACVSSQYRDAGSLSERGVLTDGGFCMHVEDTSALSGAFSGIISESFTQSAPFADVTLTQTLADCVTLTTEQEATLRAGLAAEFGLTDADVDVTRNDDGTTSVTVRRLTPVPYVKDGALCYRVAVSFTASLNDKAGSAGYHDLTTGEGGLLLPGSAGIEQAFPPLGTLIREDGVFVTFRINGEPYRVVRTSGYLSAPAYEPPVGCDFSGWSVDAAQEQVNGAVYNAALSLHTYTVEYLLADGESVSRSYLYGEEVAAPEVTAPAGYLFQGWDAAVPARMPAADLRFRAVYSRHEHAYRGELTVPVGCESDGKMTYTCACGDSYDETLPATGHLYEALTDSGEIENADAGTCVFVCVNCGARYTYGLNYQLTAYRENGRRMTYQFTMLDEDTQAAVQPDGTVAIRVPVSEENLDPNRSVYVYRVNDDGSRTRVQAYLENGFLVVLTDHFTPYEISMLYSCEADGEHPDADGDGKCDLCGNDVPDEPPTQPEDPDDPTDPTEPAEPAEDGNGICRWDGKDHGSSLWGRLVTFFHTLLWFLSRLLGIR